MKYKNDFKNDLQYSHKGNNEINAFYYKHFSDLKNIESKDDLKTQFKGIDKELQFNDGHIIKIEEKKRRKDWGDILLEIWSNEATQRKGWLYTSQSDYIVYIIEPSKKVFLLKTLALRQWAIQNQDYIDSLPHKNAINDGYITVNVAIPTEELLTALETTEYYF